MSTQHNSKLEFIVNLLNHLFHKKNITIFLGKNGITLFVMKKNQVQNSLFIEYGAEKYYALPGGHEQGYPMPHGGVPKVRPTQQAIIGQQAMKDARLRPAQTSGTSFVGIAQSALAAPVW